MMMQLPWSGTEAEAPMVDVVKQRSAVLRRARSALHNGHELPLDLRDTIRYSWIRSRLASAPLEHIAAPYVPSDGSSERLVRAAEPVLDRFAQQLVGTHVSLVLADRSARVVGRWAGDRSALARLSRVSIDEGFVLAEEAAGTNGIGTALEEMAPVTIFGEEHYTESLHRLVCVGVPIRHPLSHRIEGVLDLACPTRDSTGLLMPTALDLGAQIERELSARAPERERTVFEEFVARSRATSSALVALSEQYMVTNAAAAELLEPRDQASLWEQAAESLSAGRTVTRDLQLSGGALISARCTPITVGSTPVGVLIEASAAAKRPASTTRTRASAPTPKLAGLTPVAARSRAAQEFELNFAELVRSEVSRVVIEGEAGSGRLSAARRLHGELSPDTALEVQPATVAAVRGVQAWLADVNRVLTDPELTCLITEVDDLDDQAMRALNGIIEAADPPPKLVLATRLNNTRGRRRSAQFADSVLRVPPLRERREDIPDLAYAQIASAGRRIRIGNRAMSALMNHGWPGNLPDLEAVLSAAMESARGADIGLEHLGAEFRGGLHGQRSLSRIESLERSAIVEALREHDGNRVRAAAALGMSRSTFYRRLRLFGLEPRRSML